ncbi:MAG: UDP-N-acetylmuramoyl-L-alanyl-D-glutamate--2,6-diaminopimelate ligase [Firmicutes bacterium]|nr:UDP-N-acetylmuramoyl-L-alanyl-D-glutamate--2,6-diaminopimelate ligase [Bacillota bacterium]
MNKDILLPVYHSDKVRPGCAFFAVRGTQQDGNKFIEEALEKGAVMIVAENPDEKTAGAAEKAGARLVIVPDARKALAEASCEFFGRPSEKLFTVGITGTKGKTTTAFMVREILEEAGIRTGLIGTVISGHEGAWTESISTTPQSFEIQKMMREMADDGCRACVMEVSSQGLMQRRVHGILFDAAVFTNISPDHIGKNEHKNFQEYLYWKSQLFKQAKVAIINKDDSFWKYIADESTAREIRTFGTEKVCCGPVTYVARDIQLCSGPESTSGLAAEYILDNRKIRLNMPGKFNISNSLGAVAAAECIGISRKTAADALAKVKVRGRTEPVDVGRDFTVFVDYAHNGTALENLLKELREYRPQRIITVFGCGGGRDRNRRAEMGRTAAVFADFSIITSDNPRDEDPMEIIEDITNDMTLAGGLFRVIPDRQQAIWAALEMASEGDIVVIAGKGHETYQITGKEKRHFDDREVILRWAASCRGQDNA